MSCYIYSTIFISLAPKEKQLCERKQEDHEIRHFANFLFTFPLRSFICFCYDHLLILMAVFKNISTKFTCSLYQAKLIGNHLTPISMVNWKFFRLSFSSMEHERDPCCYITSLSKHVSFHPKCNVSSNYIVINNT